MADHKIKICDDWNGSQGSKVTWTNNTGANCVISQAGHTWPFKDGPPIPATGSIPPGGTASTHLKNPLRNGRYSYEVDCCTDKTPKTVTVP